MTHAFNRDCMEAMREFPDKHFDLLVTDPPYNTTQNDWDVKIDLKSLWIEWNRIVKDNGAFIFTSAQPFTTDLINSNRKNFKYDLIWEKSIATGFLNAKKSPLRSHEIICVFYRKHPVFNPQKNKLNTPSFKKANAYGGSSNYGQFDHSMNVGTTDGTRFPRSVFNVPYENFFFDSTKKQNAHPNQKPVALFKYLINSYSNKGDRVLDCFMGSGSSRIAAYDEGREFYGYELDKDYFEAQEKRFKQHIAQQVLF